MVAVTLNYVVQKVHIRRRKSILFGSGTTHSRRKAYQRRECRDAHKKKHSRENRGK